MPNNRLTQTEMIKLGLVSKCPQCGQGALYQGLLSVKSNCSHCKLDFSFADAGDGPAVFVITIVGFVVLGMAMWLETTISPPLYLQLLIWCPTATILALYLLRAAKAILINLQYYYEAKPAKLSQEDNESH